MSKEIRESVFQEYQLQYNGVINFFNESHPYTLKNKNHIRDWLIRCASAEKRTIGIVNFIFCSDTHLKKINRQYLAHNYFTDIITFPGSNPGEELISGDIYISIERVKDNAGKYGVRIPDELHRVMIHGILHLCDYSDKSNRDALLMRKQEDLCLKKRTWL